MAEKLVTIATYPDAIEANLAKQKLADFGIDACVTDENAANIFGGITSLAAVELQTLESNVEKAARILQTSEKQEEKQEE